MKKLTFAVFGLGRIGRIHAKNIYAHPKARLSAVVDADLNVAKSVAKELQCVAWDPESVWTDCEFDAVMIASPTPTHVDLIEKAHYYGKAIFCEKPIDLSAARARSVLDTLKHGQLMVGFNRRFDPHFQALATRLRQGEIGALHTLQITSRDPGLPPFSYLAQSGGLFKDMMIHDLDMACWLLGELPTYLYAMGSWLNSTKLTEFKDVDTAMVVMQTVSGRLCQISNNRQTGYGYDQRIEVFGESGMLAANNVHVDAVSCTSAKGQQHALPLHFFIDRYSQSYISELDAFVESVLAGKPMPITGEAGWSALVLAELAQQSLEINQVVSCERLWADAKVLECC